MADPSDANLRPASDGDRIDEQLLVASRNGDREAFRRLVERHRDDLLRFLVRFLGSRAAADDVFQDTFLQVHVSADTFDAERKFRPWLFAIAANKARDFHRRRKRRTATSLSNPVGSGDASLVDLLAAEGEAPDAPTENSEIQQVVKRVVDEMPGHYREILLLAYFQKMSYQQIAECLGIPLGTVKSRLHAAVGHFASTWKHLTGESPPGSEDDAQPGGPRRSSGRSPPGEASTGSDRSGPS
jgi:RNA polymerase sigma-70 factor (ECF subfamily)